MTVPLEDDDQPVVQPQQESGGAPDVPDTPPTSPAGPKKP